MTVSEARGRLVGWLTAGSMLVLGAAYLLPGRVPPWPLFFNEFAALVAAASMAGVFLLAAGRPRGGALALVLGLLATWVWVDRISGVAAFDGPLVLFILYLAGAALLVVIGRSQAPEDRDRWTLALALVFVVAGAVSTGLALYQWFDGTGLDIWALPSGAGQRPHANLAQANHLATLLLMALAGVGYLRATHRLGAVGAASLALYLLVGLALTLSRTAWVALGVIAAWVLIRRLDSRVTLGVSPLGAAIGLAWLAAWVVFALFGPGWLHLADVATEAASRFEAGGRTHHLAQWSIAIAASPWRGYGWGQGMVAQAVGAVQAPGFEYSHYAHNLFVDLAAWTGLPLGLALALGLTAWFFWAARRAEGPHQGFRFAVIAAIGVHSMLEYPFAYTYFLVPLMLFAGQFEAEAAESSAGGKAQRSWAWAVPRWLFVGLCLAVAVGTAATVRDYLILEKDMRELRTGLARIGGARVPPPPSDIWLLDHLAASSRAARIEPRAGMSTEQIEELLQASRSFPTMFFLQNATLALALNGRSDDALAPLRLLGSIHGGWAYDRFLGVLAERARAGDAALAALQGKAATSIDPGRFVRPRP